MSDTGKAMRDFLGTFQELYARHRHGAKYFIRRPKDPVLVKLLLETYSRERLEQIAEELLTVEDDWLDKTDRGIGILVCKASWLDSRIAERDAQQQAEDWHAECQRLHGGACGLSQWAHHLRKQKEAV